MIQIDTVIFRVKIHVVLHQSLEQSPEPTSLNPSQETGCKCIDAAFPETSHCWPDISTNWRTINLIPTDVTSVFMKLLIRRQGCRKINFGKKIVLSQATAPYNCSLRPNETMENILGSKCRTCAKSYLGAAGGARASVGTPPRGQSPNHLKHLRDEQMMSPGWNRLVDGKSHATGKGPERLRGDPINENAWWEILFDLGLLHGRVVPPHFDKKCSPPFSPPRWHQKAYLCPYHWCQTWWSLNPEPNQFSGWFPKGTSACHIKMSGSEGPLEASWQAEIWLTS